MKSANIRSTTQAKKTPAPQQQQQTANKPAAQKFLVLPLSPCNDLPAMIAARAYALYCERGYRDGSALEDWLEAERDVLSQIQSA
ncbi:MAG: DUF2934 domain-containing protein [Nitrospirota bacterium]|nr:DUF2934 domain-containing protein [Nitrospirota bacterium]MDP2382053.1 DUF2934 domain-containing protein [Nitrospirota bacterium]MDP3599492.1 DUF2934 domain-containing protein [Nitrospirota bacterium]